MRRLLVLLLVLVPAAPAAAGSGVAVLGGRMQVSDIQDTPNAVQLTLAEDGRVQVVDSTGLTAWDGCEQLDAVTARCTTPEQINAYLAGGSDLFVADDSITIPIQADGGLGDNRIRGGSGPDGLRGEYGNDQLDGGAGDDFVRGEGGNDLVVGGDGADFVHGGPGFDDLDGGLGRDTIDGDNERDRVRYPGRSAGVRVKLAAWKGDMGSEDEIYHVEIVEGTPFDDVILGAQHDEEIDGGGGDDRISGAGGADVLHGGPGADLVLGDAPDIDEPGAMPTGSGGRDDLRGGPGDDTLRGDGDRDRLAGEDGDDVIDAREGTSTQEVLDEEPACGAGTDRALLDWNDEPSECEQLEVRPRPGFPRPRPTGPDPSTVRGPGPQPVMGAPRRAGGTVRVPIHCARASTCAARVTVRRVRTVRIGGRRRARSGAALVSRRVRIAAGVTSDAILPLPRGARRGRVMVELRIGGGRWQRPLTLGS